MTVVFLPDVVATSSVGGTSPGRTIQAIVRPTGTSAPGWTFTPARTPSPGDSISITALSVSISRSASPLATESPSFFSHEMSLPVSWAISSAGITTLIAIILFKRRLVSTLVPYAHSFPLGAGFDHLAHARARFGFGLADCGQRTIHGEIMSAGNQELFGREARNDFVAGFGDHDFFFDASGTPAIGRWPESFQREHHPRLDFAGMLQRYQTADYRLLPDGETNAVTILQREGGFLVREAELLRLRPHGRDLGGRAPRAYEFNRRVKVFPAPLVRVVHCVRGIADREASVVAGTVSHVGVENVVVNGISRSKYAIGENVGMRIAALS